ncbi:MAG: Hsp20/alpha crystallin family protein [Chloroflexota bacterium]|jgi:HSP20 family protein|nr:Hsp20/alpha crystallin family protein [Lentimicrobium sp.]
MIRFNQPALSLMDQFFSNTMRETGRYNYPANIYDNENSFVIEMSAPGFNKEDFKINIEQQTLNISAETKQENEVQDEKFLRREFSKNNVSRSFILPKTVDLDSISADYTNGILKITLPRREDAVIKKEIAIQ